MFKETSLTLNLHNMEGKKSNSIYQKAYRERKKAEIGADEYKKQEALKMQKYRRTVKESTNVDETKITNKETRTLVNNLLKSIEHRIIDMVNEQRHTNIPIHFETAINQNEIKAILVNIDESMSNEDVLDAFERNEITI